MCETEYNNDQKWRHGSCIHEAYTGETGTHSHTKRCKLRYEGYGHGI